MLPGSGMGLVGKLDVVKYPAAGKQQLAWLFVGAPLTFGPAN
jgi:hypothetical protein